MNNNFLHANAVVRKITYKSENDLYSAIENNMICGSTVFKLVQVIPAGQDVAYFIFSPDPDKMIVEFLYDEDSDESEEMTEIFSSAANGDLVIMSLAEIQLLKEQKEVTLDGDLYEIEDVDMLFNELAERSVLVTVKKL